MFKPVAFCFNCRIIFQSAIAVTPNANTKIEIRNAIQSCPNCGFAAKILDGTFGFTPDGVSIILSAPQFTREILVRFNALIGKASKQNFTPQKFIEESEKITGLLSFLRYCVPKTNADLKDYLKWLIEITIAVIALKNC